MALTDSIADAAVILALRAWKSRKADLDVILPGLQDFTQDQLFFISFARTWSGLIASTPTGDLRSGFHLSARDRVHGVLRNVPEFATSFNCPAGANVSRASLAHGKFTDDTISSTRIPDVHFGDSRVYP